MTHETLIDEYIQRSIRTKQELLQSRKTLISDITKTIVQAYKQGKKVIWFGNGGSAADAQHLSCELVSKFRLERKALASIALTTNTSTLTAISNDYHFDHVFTRQIEALVQQGDVVIGISTSGNSQNVINAIKEAKIQGAKTVVFTGASGGKMHDVADHLLTVPSEETSHIQESHIMVGHIICSLVEKKYSVLNEKQGSIPR